MPCCLLLQYSRCPVHWWFSSKLGLLSCLIGKRPSMLTSISILWGKSPHWNYILGELEHFNKARGGIFLWEQLRCYLWDTVCNRQIYVLWHHCCGGLLRACLHQLRWKNPSWTSWAGWNDQGLWLTALFIASWLQLWVLKRETKEALWFWISVWG